MKIPNPKANETKEKKRKHTEVNEVILKAHLSFLPRDRLRSADPFLEPPFAADGLKY